MYMHAFAKTCIVITLQMYGVVWLQMMQTWVRERETITIITINNHNMLIQSTIYNTPSPFSHSPFYSQILPMLSTKPDYNLHVYVVIALRGRTINPVTTHGHSHFWDLPKCLFFFYKTILKPMSSLIISGPGVF